MKEGLGYSLRSYDPCFNFNNDNFCCSAGNQRLYNNIALRRARATQNMYQHTYQAPRNYSAADSAVPLWLRKTGLVTESPYTFPTSDSWYVPCSRMPCGIYANKFPCQRK